MFVTGIRRDLRSYKEYIHTYSAGGLTVLIYLCLSVWTRRSWKLQKLENWIFLIYIL